MTKVFISSVYGCEKAVRVGKILFMMGYDVYSGKGHGGYKDARALYESLKQFDVVVVVGDVQQSFSVGVEVGLAVANGIRVVACDEFPLFWSLFIDVVGDSPLNTFLGKP